MKINARNSLGAVWIALFRGDRLCSERDGAANTFHFQLGVGTVTASLIQARTEEYAVAFSRDVIKLRLAQLDLAASSCTLFCSSEAKVSELALAWNRAGVRSGQVSLWIQAPIHHPGRTGHRRNRWPAFAVSCGTAGWYDEIGWD